MKRILSIIIVAGIANLTCSSQSIEGMHNSDIESIMSEIKRCDSILSHSKKKDEISMAKDIQIAEYRKLSAILQQTIDDKNRNYAVLTDSHESLNTEYVTLSHKLNFYEKLLSNDTIVFSMELPKDEDVPPCLKSHVNVIREIQKVERNIRKVELMIEETNEKLKDLPVDKKSTIKKLINDDVMKLDKQLTLVERMDFKTLSEEQKKYFKPYLTERYNKFLEYYK